VQQLALLFTILFIIFISDSSLCKQASYPNAGESQQVLLKATSKVPLSGPCIIIFTFGEQ
jgi:hypothetical protein